jgi:hypothetical protein
MVTMNKLSRERRAQIVRALCEGNSIRSASRMTGAAINTVVSLLVDLGSACSKYQDHAMRNLPCKRLQLDEIGASSMPSRRTSRLRKSRRKARATFGPGWRFAPIRSWCPRGTSALATPTRRITSWETAQLAAKAEAAH